MRNNCGGDPAVIFAARIWKQPAKKRERSNLMAVFPAIFAVGCKHTLKSTCCLAEIVQKTRPVQLMPQTRVADLGSNRATQPRLIGKACNHMPCVFVEAF